ncbi:MAG: bifunctional diguanylate cyclase/phosphodiesterase [Pseudomonadales bacterium]|nr:bifunctional diguanylate cyclase/phosphodiesterase [Pseudomonadales bacterium]
MNEQQFDNEKSYQVYLEKHWLEDVKNLLATSGQEYFDQLVQGLAMLFGAQRVYVASFDMELKFGTVIADISGGVYNDEFEFHMPGTPAEQIAEGESILIEDGLAGFYKNDEGLRQYRGMMGRPAYDDEDNVIGLVVLLFENNIRWIDSANAIIDICISRIGTEMTSFYKTRQLNDINHQLLRELAISNQLKDELARIAYLDRVTGLPNREQFMLDLKLAAERPDGWIALCGIDCFKPVNESLGLEAGDRVLKDVGERLASIHLLDSKIYKWTGDEFLMFGRSKSLTEVEELVRICDLVFQQPVDVNGSQIRITRSTGITSLDAHGGIDEAVKAVCIAMQRAKMRGGNRAVIYENSMNTDNTQFFRVHSLMQEGITQRQFVPHYQPIYDPAKEAYVGYEALMRWIDGSGKTVFFPDQFIPIAERSGLIVELGKEMIATAISNIAEWNKIYNVERDLAINLSPLQFHDDSLVRDIERIVKIYDLAPSLIKFEITESLFVHEGDYVLRKLKDLKALGFRLSLDDFGTGYSSLAYLQNYPFDIIKVDKCFVDDVIHSSKSKALIKAVRLLASDLGMKIIAEGVETEAQAACLAMMGVDYLQGYYYSKPLPANQIHKMYGDTVRPVPDQRTGYQSAPAVDL